MTVIARSPRSAATGMLRIGEVELDNPIFIAPMAGITDRPFRELARELGAGLTCTEMTAAAAVVRAPEELVDRVIDLGAGEHLLPPNWSGAIPR